ncbi:exportin CRM1 [Sugiyamaella lignohabitans]|uniref:Exportin CRM1 n=1 Tax=Sugiyamaella lignohabitans TaxID=796027 RepID=A0A161HHX7_9ASCO|nr:exportin CRM1 [Sugiyamaella lignohabitans]ANB15760.1 exportin CRM1 [Sugiyamaella lignohabitans]
MCIEWSNDETVFRSQRPLLNKANLTLVQVLKQEWPANWPTFIPEIISASRTGFNVCENNMSILKLLSEEVFDYSAEQMTQAKAKNLKQQMCNEFSEIYRLCYEVLEKATRPSLIVATLQSLLRYLGWIPLEFIFETPLIELLVSKFLTPPQYRNVTLKCLTEISSLGASQYDKQFYTMFYMAVEVINKIVPLSTDLRTAYESAGSNDQDFIQNLSLFLSIFLANHLKIVENQENKELLINVHLYLIKISQIDEREIFKGCLDYWSRLVLELYEEIQQIPISDLNPLLQRSFATTFSTGGALDPDILANYPLRKHTYTSILSSLRTVMIEKMVRPEEVLIVESDEGEIVREFVKESDTITLYKSMREVLVYLTHLDVVDTRAIMINKLAKQIDGSEWSWNNLNTLCWAIGSISGAMNEEMEKHFLVSVIKDLLGLTEMKKGKDNKAVVASNIMYIVGQYPRFLKAHWRFLKTVVNKLFEFMHETHEGVQDMACDTFIKIAQKCKRHFVAHQQGEAEPFIDEIIKSLDKITSDLQPHQVHTFYEACGHIISAQPVKAQRERLLQDLMRLPNMAWDAMMEQAYQNPELLTNGDNIKIIINVLKTNVATCSSLGAGFYPQLARIYANMLSSYTAISHSMVNEAQGNPIFTQTHRARVLRGIKKEILKLVETYISRAEDLDEVVQNIAEPLLTNILDDYQQSQSQFREAEVLSCVDILVNRVGSMIPDMVLGILEKVFECTLDMINKSMTDFPEFRVEFFKLLRTINLHSFSALLKLPDQIFSKTIDACLWAAKHDNREVESAGLSLTLEIIDNVAEYNQPEVANKFFKAFFKPIIGDTFYVLTDTDHKAGFKTQSQILAKIISLVENNRIGVPLYDEGEASVGTSNSDYFRQYLSTSLTNAFPHLQQAQVANFVEGLFRLHRDPIKFKLTLRDFLVQIKEFGGDSTDYLFAEEKETELQEKQRLDRERALKVGGLIKPSEMEEEDS